MNEAQFVFLWELMTLNLEKSLVEELEDGQPGARAAYAAYLRQTSRPRSARLVESGWSPGFPPPTSGQDPRTAYEFFHAEG